jgi:hypothetical protein
MSSTKRLLVENILDEIRRRTGETNEDGSISGDMLLDAINRGQEESAMILARNYPTPLLTYTTVVTTAGEPEYDVPEDAIEGRIQQVELLLSDGTPRALQPRDVYDNVLFEAATSSGNREPEIWMEVGFTRKIRVLPQPTAGYTLRIWYCKELPQLAISQGMITATATNTLTLDEVGDDISTSLDEPGSHLCIIDGQTGVIKGAVEVSGIDSTTGDITLRATPSVTTIDNLPISALASISGVAVGDFVCVAPFTCICQIRQPFINHMVSYVFALLQYLNGGDIQVPQAELARMEKYVSKMKKGRVNNLRVAQTSHSYRTPMIYRQPRTR